MEKGRTNYSQDWGNDIARAYRRAWNGGMAFDEFATLFVPSLAFHFHDSTANGTADFWSFIQEIRRNIPGLDIVDETVLSHGDKILMFYRWRASAWHADIVGAGETSGYCKVVLRLESGRIAEIWQQAPDFLYLLGKRSISRPMQYPIVVEHPLLIEDEAGVHPADDTLSMRMRAHFEVLDSVLLNRASPRAMADVLHADLQADPGDGQTHGLDSWKTLIYSLRTGIGGLQGTRFDDICIRKGNAMRVYSRISYERGTPWILDCTQGMVSWTRFSLRDDRIQRLETLRENHIPFLDTDFDRHKARIAALFRGQREPMAQAMPQSKAVAAPVNRKNYLQAWGNAISSRLREAWNGTLPFDRFAELFDPALIFHFHDERLVGIEAYQRFIERARASTQNLDLAEEMVFSHEDMVQIYHRWASDRWHQDIKAGGPKSNYCKIVVRVANGRIAEIWQQAPDFIYLLGKLPTRAPMQYPQVVAEKLLVREEGGLHPADDEQTRMMSQLFMRMNDCFMNRSSLRNMKDIQNEDIVYNTGGSQGMGVQSWKTFAYALHTCLGTNQGTRFDDLYVRDGDRMRVFLRASTVQSSPYILKCAEGAIASMMLTARDGKIRSLETSIENYIQFLDTDFGRHPERLKNLFRGMREPVAEALPAPGPTPAPAPAQAQAQAPAEMRPAAEPVMRSVRDDATAVQVAIVGMAGRFPGCGSVAELWQALSSGASLISEVPASRTELVQGTDIRHAGFIREPDLFDAAFFQVLPSEAEYIDPQQRMLMEEIVHSIEDSGHALSDFSGERTGLFITTLCEDYKKLLQDHGLVNTPQTWAGNENAMFPAKLARFLDVQGPCHFINAECTSALVALHQASQLIRLGRIDQAIVGASNLLLHPYGFVVRRDSLLTDEPQASLFSKDSRGQLRGEAIVSVVLKSLARAQEDGDRIYGIVAGSAVNNSGRTLSLVAGNVARQASVITEAWQAAGIDGADVSLIECHASGVRGGDFAEIAAIKQALASSARARTQACHIATAKGAIGHSEAASGLSSLVKVLLQLRHGQIAGIHGLGEIDPALGIDPSSLQPVATTIQWDAPRRVAGINGFAAGGYNAHVVIEGYAQPAGQPRRAGVDTGPEVILLSAHSESSFMARIRDLRRHLHEQPQVALADLAFTLQRQDAMKHRGAFVVDDIDALAQMLDAMLAGEVPAHAFVGRKRGMAASAGALPSEAPRDLEGWLALARQWSEGRDVAWAQLGHHAGRRRLTDLPQYPFDSKPYWLPASGRRRDDAAQRPAQQALHPLLQKNVSTLEGQRYWSEFDGTEHVLRDHLVNGHRVLPGVAYLEMVRAAVCDALGHDIAGIGVGADHAVQLRNVVWMQPISLDPASVSRVRTEVTLHRLEGAQSASRLLAFEVSTLDGDQRRIHCQGQACVQPLAGDARIDPGAAGLEALRSACRTTRIPPDAVYDAYRSIGLDYGPAYRSVKALCSGPDAAGSRQVLAELALPEVETIHPDCALHPSMMDGAVHSLIAMVMEDQALPQDGRPPLPFALERLEVLHPCTRTMWAWIRQASGNGQAEAPSPVQKYDIDVIDALGRVCVRMHGFSTRTTAARNQAADDKRHDSPRPVAARPANSDDAGLHRKLVDLLKMQVAAILQVAESDIDAHDELSQYGFDSINLTSFGNQLNDTLRLSADRMLNPTIFFEHPTLDSFARYLARDHRAAVEALFGIDGAGAPDPVPVAALPSHGPAATAEPMRDHAPDGQMARAIATTTSVGESREDIAIVGISGRFPLAADIEEFWANLFDGRDCITEVPADRWDWRELHGSLKEPNRTDVKWGGFIDGIAEFDPLFFGISPREAELMDPQQRLLMQHAWQAIEDAGHNPRSLSGSRTGVFLATAHSGYTSLLAQANIPIEGSTAAGALPSVGPNRISFFLNLSGPSEPIETACSSSLVAIHRAITAIRTGSCDMALVGGVNTIVTPDAHIGFRKAGMLCEDGRCKTFSSEANGYVRGEGIGVLFIKRLSDAVRSGDPIYALIKGSAENHGGRANSLTSPNPTAQADLVKAAHIQAGIDPRSIGYIEAHGTGTELGDPIEVNGLKAAFNELYRHHDIAAGDTPHCGLGSVKSNIGHLELAAGVAGVVKVLMQFRHATLVKSLHTEQINPYIQLQGTPFYVVQGKRPWTPAVDAQGALPRRAGVSAFSFGGANAHVVLEEYPAPAKDMGDRNMGNPGLRDEAQGTGPWLVVLSGRTTARLEESARRLLDVLNAGRYRGLPLDDTDLPHLAYTLLIGRDAMAERLAVLVHSLDELRSKLAAFLAGDTRIAGLYRGNEKAHRESLSVFGDEDLGQTLATWLAKGKLKPLAELWVKGVAIDWQVLYAGTSAPCRRINLPAYPFANERYWVPGETAGKARDAFPGRDAATARLHPLVHRNTSDFKAQRYSSTFDGREFFFRDHVVRQHRVLPAAAYLEMARAAVADATRSRPEGIRLRNIAWAQPIGIEEDDVSRREARVHVGLALTEAGDVAFSVYTNPDEEVSQGPASRLHCHGIASLRDASPVAALEIDTLRARCTGRHHAAGEVYAAFDAMGLRYGPAHRAVETLACSDAGEVLARLRLDASCRSALGDYVLHPGLLDAALQSSIGLVLDADAANGMRPRLPFHLKALDIFASCSESMWAWIRKSPVAAGADRASESIDIDLCDDHGTVCARLQGFVARELPEQAGVQSHSAPEHSVLLTPVWQLVSPGETREGTPSPVGRVLVLASGTAADAARSIYPEARILEALPDEPESILRDIDHVVWIAPDTSLAQLTDEDLIDAQARGVLQAFAAIRHLIDAGQGGKPIRWTFVTTQAQAVDAGECPNPMHAAVLGLAGSLAKEYPVWPVRAIDLPCGWSRGEAQGASLQDADALPFDPVGATWARRDGQWYRQFLVPSDGLANPAPDDIDASSYKRHGVYVVVGGAGGIGEAWTAYMIRTYQARIIWIGRRQEDEAIATSLDRLAEIGPRPRYIRADATRRDSLEAAYRTIKDEFPRIDGIVHSALVLRDSSLSRMSLDDFRTVLSTKVDVSVRIAQVFGQEPLDFVLFFSSLVSFGRPPGQANYVAGCVFKDAFAQRMRHDGSCVAKVMNWGYWGHIGVAASDAYRQRMARLGVGSIEEAEAMASLERLLCGPVDQVALVKLTRPVAELARGLYASFLSVPGADAEGSQTATVPVTTQVVHDPAVAATQAGVDAHVVDAIKQVLSDALKVSPSAIDADEPFTDYGLDSITGVHLAQTLNDTFGVELDVTLFFDYSTVRSLSRYLLEQHAEAMAASLARKQGNSQADGAQAPATGVAATSAAIVHAVAAPSTSTTRFAAPAPLQAPMVTQESPTTEPAVVDGHDSDDDLLEGIAIVGLSACFPGAPDAETLWNNLLEGRNSIGEVPAERWNWQQVTGDTTRDVERTCYRWGAFIDDVGGFDAGFFDVEPEEAQYMSPQQRLLLTHAWKAMEDAAIAPKELSAEPTGVFIATVPSEYLNIMQDARNVPMMVMGLTTSMIPNRISYSLNLRGPSEHFDTACSSSLVALHRAVQSLRNGECRQAIVGAINLLLTPAGHIGFESMNYLSPTGRMSAFQSEANGFVRAEGVGVVILKPLRQAVRDRNRIHAVIAGSGVSHGGQTVSMTTPNGTGMREAIRQAYEVSGIDPGTVSYIEAHGIASPLGDAIEISAIKSEYHRIGSLHGRVAEAPCHIGSARTCIGYPEVASGMLSLVKVIMAMRHRVIPGIPRFTHLHDNISLKNSRFRMGDEHHPWEALVDAQGRALPRRAAINNYGFSGVNAHLLLEEYVPAQAAGGTETANPQLFVMSAKTPEALRSAVDALMAFVESDEATRLDEIAYTLQRGRAPMEQRLAIVARNREGLVAALKHVIELGPDQPFLHADAVVHGGRAAKSDGRPDAEHLDLWLDQHRLDALAAYWAAGGDLPWERLRHRTDVRRIGLPGYPMAPTRHWITDGTGLSALHGRKQTPPARNKRSESRPRTRA